MRTLVYTDYAYHRDRDGVYSERAFSLFLARVAAALDGETAILGRLTPGEAGGGHYPIGGVDFRPLPYYPSLVSLAALVALPRSLGRAWRAIGEADRVWLLGPHPLIPVLALIARLRRKALVLGVRQDSPAYVRSRHPGRRLLHLVAGALEGSFRRLARRAPVVVVGPVLARNYAHAPELLEIAVSLVSADQVVDAAQAEVRSYDGTRTVLSVGRLDNEKNPVMLVDVLQRLLDGGGDWRLEICGEGPLLSEVEDAVSRAGLGERVELAGYVPFDAGLSDRYRSAHVLLHSSLTEGLPQVLLEAFAGGLPVVASDVGGIRDAVGACVRLIPADDPAAAATAVAEVAGDPELRQRLVEAGIEYVRAHTIEIESARVAEFLERVARR